MTDPSPSSPSAAVPGEDERAAAKLAMAWTHTARFLTTASKLAELPVSELPEIAFVGRSNAGKSTAINVLTQQKRLAFASKTPGRTQHINLFELGPKLGARCAVRRPAGLRLRRGRARHEAALAAGDGRVPRDQAQPGGDRHAGRFAAGLHRARHEPARLRRRRASATEPSRCWCSDQGRQAEPARARRRVGRAQDTLAPIIGETADVGVAPFSALSRQGVNDAAVWLHRSSAVRGGVRALAAFVGRSHAGRNVPLERSGLREGRRAQLGSAPCCM